MVTQLLSENQVLRDQLARVTCFLEMNSSHIKQKPFHQLFSTVEDQSSQSLLPDAMNHKTKLPPHNDASLFSTLFSQEESKVRELFNKILHENRYPEDRRGNEFLSLSLQAIATTSVVIKRDTL